MFLVRFIVVLVVLAGLGLGALFALGALVEPEQREVQVSVPLPKPKG